MQLNIHIHQHKYTQFGYKMITSEPFPVKLIFQSLVSPLASQ